MRRSTVRRRGRGETLVDRVADEEAVHPLGLTLPDELDVLLLVGLDGLNERERQVRVGRDGLHGREPETLAKLERRMARRRVDRNAVF